MNIPLNPPPNPPNNLARNPIPLWLWLALFAAVAILFWGSRSWFMQKAEENIAQSPFLQVTNREFSLFLWHNPEYMRADMRSKTGYLPAFQYGQLVTVKPELADQYLQAPHEMMFLYHTWNRLLGKERMPCPIPARLFEIFVNQAQEWLPKYWSAAPKEYKDFVAKISAFPPDQDLAQLPLTTLPEIARSAFIGWKNNVYDREEIADLKPTFEEMQAFIKRHPNYARNYWRNILIDSHPDYLTSLKNPHSLSAFVPSQEMAPFLKAAFHIDKECNKK